MITVMNLVKQLLKVLLLGSALWALWNALQVHQKNINAASIKRALRRLMRYKYLLALAAVVYLVAYSLCSYVRESNRATEVIKLNYEEASKGQNPNQTRFNASQILSDEMLQEVIRRGAYDVTTDELAACLSLSSSFDNRGIGNVDSVKVATEYRVYCGEDVVQYDIKPKDVLSLLADVYYDYFITHYAENDQILTLNLSVVDSMDYMDVDDYLSMKATQMGAYIKNYGYEDSSFRMEETGETFGSIGEKIDNFQNVTLERYRSFVLQNGLSNNKTDYSMRMDYENRQLQVEYEKNMAAYDVRLEGINLYDEQMATIVLVPSTDLGNELYMSRTKIGVDNFANEADDYLKKATDLKTQMEHKQYADSQIQESTASEAMYEQADRMIAGMKQELTDLSVEAQALSDAYLQEKRNGYLYIGMGQTDMKTLLGLKKGVIYSGGFLAMLCAALMLKDLREQGNEEGEEA